MNVAVTTEHFHDMKHNNGNSKSRPVESKCCFDSGFPCLYVTFKKYKTFSVLTYSYINTSGNWKNEKLCGNTTPAGRSVFTQFRVFPIVTSVDITVYQYGKNV